eukprot:5931513-Alexandrium_andersonii.AAC.1
MLHHGFGSSHACASAMTVWMRAHRPSECRDPRDPCWQLQKGVENRGTSAALPLYACFISR